MIGLAPMSAAEFEAYAASSVPDYARQKVRAGQWSEANALELARRSFAELLPQGLSTPGNHLFTLRAAEGGEPVGMLWFAVQERAGEKIAYVYDVGIDPRHRRRGHARAAFEALEAEVRSRGLAGIGLHVFGHNRAARVLYEKLGYEATSISMWKPLADADPGAHDRA